MANLNTLTPSGNTVDRDPSDDGTRRPDDFARRAAKAELGNSYAQPELDGFRDRRPGEVAILRALNWSGAAR